MSKLKVPEFRLVPQWCPSLDYTASSKIRARGEGVASVAVDSEDRVYAFVRDDPISRVAIFDRNGEPLSSWGEEFIERPHGITITPENDLFLVEDYGCSVKKYTLEGKELQQFGPSGIRSDTGSDWRSPYLIDRVRTVRPDGGPPYSNPTKAAVAPNGDVYVSDGYYNCKVHRFSADGTPRASWGRAGSGPGEFRIVHSVIITPAGKVYIADRENDRIQVFSLDGEYIDQWVSDDLHRPHSIALGPDGYFYVGEARCRLGRFTFRGGESLSEKPARISIRDDAGNMVGQLPGVKDPHGLAFDSSGDLFAANSFNLHKFERL